jgi:hypothetical protein
MLDDFRKSIQHTSSVAEFPDPFTSVVWIWPTNGKIAFRIGSANLIQEIPDLITIGVCLDYFPGSLFVPAVPLNAAFRTKFTDSSLEIALTMELQQRNNIPSNTFSRRSTSCMTETMVGFDLERFGGVFVSGTARVSPRTEMFRIKRTEKVIKPQFRLNLSNEVNH